MSDITTYKSVPIQTLMDNLTKVKYNPSGIQRVVLDYLDEVTNGEVDIVDPTNPFVFLLESSAVNTALAIKENIINLRRQYPSLAQTEDELYLHLSDKDFIDRFAVPSETDFTVVIQLEELINSMVYDPIENCDKACIPRDTEFKVNELTFTLQYPIYLRKYSTGQLQIMYDTEIESPLQVLKSNVIDYTIRRDPEGINYVFFEIPLKQFTVESTYYNINFSSPFQYDINYNDQFWYCRVYQRNDNTFNKWKELKTTHTDQVYDPFDPTAVLKVHTNILQVFIPYIYIDNRTVSGDIRIDIYSTKGKITVNLANMKLNNFNMRFRALDTDRDYNAYTNVLNNVTHYCVNKNIISGGTNGIDFSTLRERVIFNSTGEHQIPITNIQIESYVNNRGFDLIKNVDVVTNRIFLATKTIPKPLEPKLITAANIGIAPFVTNLEALKQYTHIRSNNNRLTILSNNIYSVDNGRVRMLTDSDLSTIEQMSAINKVNDINAHQYLYSPFYYVLDSSKAEFEVRAYNLDYPVASNLSFKSQNQTLQLIVNTDKYVLEKHDFGYRLTITTKSGNFYKQIADSLVNVQLGYYPVGGTSMAYIDGEMLRNINGDRVYKFDILTNYDIDSEHLMCLNNSRITTDDYIFGWVNLSHQFHIFYTTSSVTTGYIRGEADALIGTKYLPTGSVAVTHETIDLKFGTSLKNLWTRCRTFASGMQYRTYPEDVPLVYEKDIYEQDPVTGSIFTITDNGELIYNVAHRFGDTALDGEGRIIYKHRKGDVMLDFEGKPIVVSQLISDVEFDMLYVDAKYWFATDSAFVRYRKELNSIIDTWITKDLMYIQDVLLEQTKIYFYSKTSLVSVKVMVNNAIEKYIDSEQSLVVDLYVRNDVYENNDIRDKLELSTVKLLDAYIKDDVINVTELVIALKDMYDDSVVSLMVKGLGGVQNYNIVTLSDSHNRLCLKKRLVLQQDGTTIVEEDVTVNFFNLEKPLLE